MNGIALPSNKLYRKQRAKKPKKKNLGKFANVLRERNSQIRLLFQPKREKMLSPNFLKEVTCHGCGLMTRKETKLTTVYCSGMGHTQISAKKTQTKNKNVAAAKETNKAIAIVKWSN